MPTSPAVGARGHPVRRAGRHAVNVRVRFSSAPQRRHAHRVRLRLARTRASRPPRCIRLAWFLPQLHTASIAFSRLAIPPRPRRRDHPARFAPTYFAVGDAFLTALGEATVRLGDNWARTSAAGSSWRNQSMKLALGFAATSLCLALGTWSGTARADIGAAAVTSTSRPTRRARSRWRVVAPRTASRPSSRSPYAASSTHRAKASAPSAPTGAVRASCDLSGCDGPGAM